MGRKESNQTNKPNKNSVDPDQLASQNPADLDLHCFQNRIYIGVQHVHGFSNAFVFVTGRLIG